MCPEGCEKQHGVLASKLRKPLSQSHRKPRTRTHTREKKGRKRESVGLHHTTLCRRKSRAEYVHLIKTARVRDRGKKNKGGRCVTSQKLWVPGATESRASLRFSAARTRGHITRWQSETDTGQHLQGFSSLVGQDHVGEPKYLKWSTIRSFPNLRIFQFIKSERVRTGDPGECGFSTDVRPRRGVTGDVKAEIQTGREST